MVKSKKGSYNCRKFGATEKTLDRPAQQLLSDRNFTPPCYILLGMKQSIVYVALVVREYDEAIEFYTKKLHFTLIEDTYQPKQDKRWVVVAPPGSSHTKLLLARASKLEQKSFIGNQTGGRVFLFLKTDDFWKDYKEMVSAGIKFVRKPKAAPYGRVAVFEDLYGNLWDLVELK